MIIRNASIRPVEVLSTSDVEMIHQASMRILDEIGIVFPSSRVLDVLGSINGVRVNSDRSLVKIPPDAVGRAISSCPSTFRLLARNPARDVTVGGNTTVLMAVGGCTFSHDTERGRRVATLEDFRQLTHLSQMLPQVDVVTYDVVEPQDIPLAGRALEILCNALDISDKPVFTSADGLDNSIDSISALDIVLGDRGSEPGAARLVVLVNVTSPLTYDPAMLEGLIKHAEAGSAIILAPGIMSGMSGPITLAGCLAQQNAEVLAGILLAQAVNPGVPTIYGCFTSSTDMRLAAPAYGSPETALMVAASAQMARRYGLPSRGGGALTDSKAGDEQAGYEKMMTMMSTIMSGINFAMHSLGHFESFMATSFEQFVLDAEIAGMVERFAGGLKVTQDTLALDVIASVGPGASFISTNHTYANFRGQYYEPKLSDRKMFADWMADGGKTALERARERYTAILSQPSDALPLDPTIKVRLSSLLSSARSRPMP